MTKFNTYTMPVTGMTCTNCAGTIERSLRKLLGVSSAAVDFAGEKLIILIDSAQIDEKAIISRIRQIGYGISTSKVDVSIIRIRVISDPAARAVG